MAKQQPRAQDLPADDDGGARIFHGFPLPYTEDKVLELRRLADLMECGSAEVVVINVVFRYYHEANNEDGYELRTGVIQSLKKRGD